MFCAADGRDEEPEGKHIIREIIHEAMINRSCRPCDIVVRLTDVSTQRVSAEYRQVRSSGAYQRGPRSRTHSAGDESLRRDEVVDAFSLLTGNDAVQIHFNYSYKLRIFFHTVRFAYRKMKDGKKLGASIKLRKKEIFEDGWGILEF